MLKDPYLVEDIEKIRRTTINKHFIQLLVDRFKKVLYSNNC